MQKNHKVPALLIISILLVVCGYSLNYNILGNTMDPLIEEFRLTGAAQGLMTSMMSFGGLIPLLVLPMLQGRVHKTWLIFYSGVLQVAMLVLTGASGNFTPLLTACVLLGAGKDFTDSCINSYMVDLHPGDSARSLGLLHGFFGIGGLITPLLVNAILKASGWRAAYYAAAVLFAAICLFFLAASLRSRKLTAGAEPAKETPLSTAMLKDYLSSSRNLLLLAAAAFYGASQIGLTSWVVRYTSVQFNDVEIGSYCLSAYWICATICRLVSPRLPYAPGKMLAVGAAGAGVFHALGILSASGWGMLAASGLTGLVSGLCIPVMLGEAAIGNEDRTSLTTSGIFLAMALARIITPLGMGAVGAFSLPAAMLIPAAAALLCALCSHWANGQMRR